MHLLFSRKVDNLPPCNNYFVDKQEPFLKFSKFAMFIIIMLYDTTKTKLKVKEDLQLTNENGSRCRWELFCQEDSEGCYLIRTSFDFSLGLKINKVVSVKHGGVPWSWGCYCNEKIFRVYFFNRLIWQNVGYKHFL